MTTAFNRVILVIIDSLGIGELPDANEYGDAGSDTLGHIAEATRGLHLPRLEALGLGRLGQFKGLGNMP
jgi:phosphopentomutase